MRCRKSECSRLFLRGRFSIPGFTKRWKWWIRRWSRIITCSTNYSAVTSTRTDCCALRWCGSLATAAGSAGERFHCSTSLFNSRVGEFLAANTKRDFYEVLGVTRVATDVEIKSAYRKLAMTYHPDRNPNNPDAEDKFKELTEAYAILADGEKRSLYDRFGHAGVSSNAGAAAGFDPAIFQDFGDIFGEFFGFGDLFGGGGGGRRRPAPRRGHPP